MKVTRFLASLLFLGAVTTTAFADGVVNLSWDACTGPINKSILPGTQASAYVSVLGQSITSQAYQVQLRIGNGTPTISDAWRFDAAGCQGSALLSIDHLAPSAVSKVCPSFQGLLASVQIPAYLYDEPGQPGRARAVLYNAYPNNACSGCPPQGNPAATVPTQRYFLARFLFDETFGANGPSDPGNTCGGLEVGTCLAMISQSWLDTNGNEFPWTLAQDYLTANDANNLTRCPGATPTKATTWGSLKNQYR